MLDINTRILTNSPHYTLNQRASDKERGGNIDKTY